LTNFSAGIARDEKILLLKKNPSDKEGRSAAGLPDFLYIIPEPEKVYRMTTKYIYRMDLKYTKWLVKYSQ
jgi:hypothetical protein